FLDTCIETGEPQYLEEYVSALDSWIEAKIFRLPAPEQLAVLFNNVTARKKAELELRRSEEQFRLLVIATSNMVYRMSADWSEMYNLNGKNILADTEHPTGSWVEKYIPEEERPLVDHKIRQAIQAKSIFELEHRVVQANGSVGWVYSRAVPMLDHDGNITEWLGAGSDITPRKEAEDAQNESERRFKASSAKYLSLFNSIDQGFCIVEMIFNTEGIPVDYRVLETNPAFKKLSGMHEATGKTMRTLAPDMDEHWYRIFGEVAQTGVPKRFVERVTRVDRWFDVYAFEIDTRAGHIAILFNDVTQQKRQEEQQRYLIRLSGALYSAPNPEEIKEASARILGEQVKAARGFYFTTERHGRGPQSGLTSAGAYSLGIDTPDSEIVRFPEIGDDLYADIAAGKPLIVEDVGLPGQPVYSCRDPYLKLGIRSFVIVPFTKNGNAVAAFAVTDNFPRKWSVHEISLVKVTVERTWEAVERARAELALRENEALYRSRLEQEVTERTAELRQTKDLLRGTLNSSLSSIQVFRSVRDQTGKIVDFTWILNNDTSEKTFGAVNGKSLLQRNPGVVPSGIFDHFVQVAETGIPQQYEIRYNFENYDGWYYQSVVKLGDGVAATTADITLRKLAEEERFRNYLLLQQSEELAQSGSWDLDLLSGVVNWSDGMYRLFAIPQGVQVKPEIYLESATPKGRRVVERLVRHLRDADHEFEETVELKVGEKVKVLHVKAAVVRDDQGIPVRILGVDMDISAMREAERQLRDLQVRQQQEILLVTLNTQEKERRRISENLHNGLAQMLYA
ncbi:MAG TPA: PAS domain S-box protein, partial [Sphingobacteriaceae bacterium]